MAGHSISRATDSVNICTGGGRGGLDRILSQPVSTPNLHLLVFWSCLNQVVRQIFSDSRYADQSLTSVVRL